MVQLLFDERYDLLFVVWIERLHVGQGIEDYRGGGRGCGAFVFVVVVEDEGCVGGGVHGRCCWRWRLCLYLRLEAEANYPKVL